MAITLVDVGTTANDDTGDPLRTAFQTVNTALTRLDDTVDVQTGYVLLKDDSGTTGVVVTTAGNAGIGTTAPEKALHTYGSEDGAGILIQRASSDAGAFGGLYFKTRLGSPSNPKMALLAEGVGGSWGVGKLHLCVNGTSGDSIVDLTHATITIDNSQNVGIGTTGPTEALDVNGDAIRIRSSQTPASASATGDAGQICWDSSYIYVCTATNTWKRAALATW
jgi:hypothetical protein